MPITKVSHVTPSRHNRMLPPAWRWERANWLRSLRRRPRRDRGEDPWVALAVKFQNEIAACRTPLDHERLHRRYPGLYVARELYGDENQASRWAIEAYLCADARLAHIVERTGEHIETVGSYARLFFDVAGKHKHWLYMLNKVIGPSVHHGLADRNYDLLWKLYGLLKGPLFLDQIIRYDREPTRVGSYSEGRAAFRDAIRDSLENKVLLAARTLPVQYNQEVIFAAYSKLLEIEQEGGGAAGGGTLLTANIHKMVCNFGFTPAVDANIDHHLPNGVERRSGDIVRQALGMPSTEALAAVPSFGQVEQEARNADQQGS